MDLSDYKQFVHGLLAPASKDHDAMMTRLQELHDRYPEINFPALATAAHGMSAEAGEFLEIVKKVQWQGKELPEETIFHLKREIGDILFYATTACIALGIDLDTAFDMNFDKLVARYPGGFTVHKSENRKVGDV